MIPHSTQQQLRQAALRQFRVRLGHVQVVVQGESSSEAIRQARRKLSHELPRLWDKIHTLGEQHFTVEIV